MNNENTQLNFEKLNFFIDFFTLLGIVYGAFLSFFCPIVGIVLGIVFLSAGSPKIRRIGRLYLILGIVGVVIGIIFMGIFLITRWFPFLQRFGYLS
ncbi:MAG: hypothetical protein ABIK77_06955 [candidate division WOR-3 bacterium]